MTNLTNIVSSIIKSEDIIVTKLSSYVKNINPVVSGLLTVSGDANVSGEISGYRFYSTKTNEYIDNTISTLSGELNSTSTFLSTAIDNLNLSGSVSTVISSLNILSGDINAISSNLFTLSGELNSTSTFLSTAIDNLNLSGSVSTVISSLNILSGDINAISSNLFTLSGELNSTSTFLSTAIDNISGKISNKFITNNIVLTSMVHTSNADIDKEVGCYINNVSSLVYGTLEDVSLRTSPGGTVKPKIINLNIGIGNTVEGLASFAHGNTDIVSGNYAVGLNYAVSALADSTLAHGEKTCALGKKSHAEGARSISIGESSHAEGKDTYTVGEGSHAEGANTVASGMLSHAEGSNASAFGGASHAEGMSTQSIGSGSHTEGLSTITYGLYSHAEGFNTNILQNCNYSHAEGINTLISGNGVCAHAEGNSTSAITSGAHAEGLYTFVGGQYGHAEGRGTVITGGVYYQHVEGKYNIIDKNNIYQHIVGAGTDNEHRINIQTLDWNGNEWVSGNISAANLFAKDNVSAAHYYTSDGQELKPGVSGNFLSATNPSGTGNFTLYNGNFIISSQFNETFNINLDAAAKNNIAILYADEGMPGEHINISGSNNLIVGSSYSTTYITIDKNAEFGIMHGAGCTLSGKFAYVAGFESQAIGDFSYAQGNDVMASGSFSHAEGSGTKANGNFSHAEGNSTETNGGASHAEGYATETSGNFSHAEGNETLASGDYSHAEGEKTIAYGNSSHAEGQNTKANGDSSHAEGYATETSGNFSHAEGNETLASGDYSHAEGEKTIAYGKCSHTEGYQTITSALYTHAEGWKTQALSQASHVEGSQTSAVGGASHAEGFKAVAYGNYAHAEGHTTSAYAPASHAEGRGTYAGDGAHAEGQNTIASGYYSHTEGQSNIVLTQASHAEGYSTYIGINENDIDPTGLVQGACHTEGYFTSAYGYEVHAEGKYTKGIGRYVHIEGVHTVASGRNLHAEGYYTIAKNSTGSEYGIECYPQHVEGRYNIEDATNKYQHIVGGGAAEDARKNIQTLDWEGNLWTAGTISAKLINTDENTIYNLGTITSTSAISINNVGIYSVAVNNSAEITSNTLTLNFSTPSDSSHLHTIRLQLLVYKPMTINLVATGHDILWVDDDIQSMNLENHIYFIVCEYNPILNAWRFGMEEDARSFTVLDNNLKTIKLNTGTNITLN